MNDIRSKVALIKSSKLRAEDISESEINDMVREVVKLAGGLDFIQDGQLVVIKPNLVSTRMFNGPFKPAMMAFTDAHKEKSQIPEFVNGINPRFSR